ncbi:MAG: CHAT domain-containing protein [Aureispira sp.]|nr:CHAT domain-containing protein [Aureispira sp.]
MKLFYFTLLILFINNPLAKGQDTLDLSIVQLDTIIDQYEEKKDNEAVLKYTLLKVSKIELEQLHDTILANGLSDLVICYRQQGNYAEATENAKRALMLWENEEGHEYWNSYQQFLFVLANFSIEMGDYAEAERLFLKLIELEKNDLSKSSVESQAQNFTGLAVLYTTIGRYEEAIDLYLEAESIYKKKPNSYKVSNVKNLSGLGTAYSYAGDYSRAKAVFSKALELQATISLEDEIYATLLNNLACANLDLNIYEGVETQFIDAIAIYETIGRVSMEYLNCLNNAADFYRLKGSYENAEVLFLKARDLTKKTFGTQQLIYAGILNNLAIAYGFMGKHKEQSDMWAQALEILKPIVGKEHKNYTITQINLAKSYQSIGKYGKAKKELSEVLVVYEKKPTENKFQYAQSLFSLGQLHYYQKEYDLAENKYKGALDILKKEPSKGTLYATILTHLGKLYRAKGEYANAQKSYLDAIGIFKEGVGTQYVGYFYTLNYMIELFCEMKDYKNAKDYVRIALKANIKSGNDNISIDLAQLNNLLDYTIYDTNNLIATFMALSRLYQSMYNEYKDEKKLAQKQEVLELAIKVLNKARINFNTSEDKLISLAKTTGLVSSYLKTVWHLGQKADNPNAYAAIAFSYAEQNKSMLLADATRGQAARTMGDLPDSLINNELKLQKELSTLNKKIAETNEETESAILEKERIELRLQVNEFKQLLKDKYPKYHQLKYEDITPTAIDIQDNLKEGEVMIEYFVADSAVYVFSLSQETINWIALDIEKVTLDSQVAKLHRSLSDYKFITDKPDAAYDLYTQTAYWFYKNVLEPIFEQNDIATMQHLIVVADGELGNLPFEVFLTEQSPNQPSYVSLPYLIKKYKVSYNYSAALMKATHTTVASNNNGEILGIAAQYDKDVENLSKTRLPYLRNFRKFLRPLPNAQKEVEGIKQYIKGTFLSGIEATERNFKKEAGKYAILHLAMHGLLNKYTPILSSLAFTEDGDSLEDNFLQAWEISKLKLNAELVVLSACETGYGRFEQGEGILSIARSFIYAGVPSLVVSLWSVNDASTSNIMQRFYSNLAQGSDKASALQEAKLTYIKNTKGVAAHPAFWSPFIQIGNHKTVSLTPKSNTNLWLYAIIGSLILLLGGGILVKRNRAKEA